MKRLAAFLIFLLAGSLVPAGLASAGEEKPVATFHIAAGQPQNFQIGDTEIYWDGVFQYSSYDGWSAEFHVVFLDGTGVNHSVLATPKGDVDAEGRFIWILTDYNLTDTPQEKQLGLLESWNELVVKFIDPLSGKVVIDDEFNGKTYTLHVGDKIDITGGILNTNISEKVVLELKNIETGLFGSKVDLILHHYTITTAEVELYPYQASQNATKEEQNQTNTPPKTSPLNLSTPTAMIIVGEHAAGVDVAAGAKVAIAVQKWIDIIKEKGPELAVPGLGHLGGLIAKAVTTPIQNLNADAMLDTEVKNPDAIAPVVYTVGGPVANEYTKAILTKNADRLPVKFVKEGNQWYIEDNHGNKWGKGYGLILIIPAAEDPLDLQMRLSEGKIKMADVVVAGTDRWGTYAACDLLQGEFMKPILGEKPRPELEYFIEVQGRMLLLFGQNPLEAFDVNLDPTNPFKFQTIAVIVNKNGQIVKVLTG